MPTESLDQIGLIQKGYWFPPTFLTGLGRDGAASSAQAGVTHAHGVASEEIFGPVLNVMAFRTPEEAFERANNIPYGLSAGVWTNSDQFFYVARNTITLEQC